MTSNEILKADLLDILFDQRNKTYGAYSLRKQYNRSLTLSLAISLSTGLLLFFLIKTNATSSFIDKIDDPGVIVRTLPVTPDLKKPEPVIPKNTQPAQQARQEKFTTYKIMKDILVPKTVPDLTSLRDAIISNFAISGTAAGIIPVVKDTVSGNGMNATKKNNAAEPFQREPEFPGGTQAWKNFLRKNLIPPGELEPGDKKTVVVRFLVDTDGAVTGFEVTQSGGREYDSEVIRVLKKMPKWKPAIQNGEPAPRAFTQPVTFIGQEE
jgi:protein TonB